MNHSRSAAGAPGEPIPRPAAGIRTRRLVLAASLLSSAFHPCLAQTCAVSATTSPFGQYSPNAVLPTDTTANILLSCQSSVPKLVTYSIALSTGSSGTYGGRSLRSGNAALGYQVYVNAPRTTIWGDGSSGTSLVAGALQSASIAVGQTQTAYARMPAKQNATPGIYSDTIMVTVTW